MQDKSIWQTIGGKKFCSYKLKTQFDTFCKNKNNVSGLCTEHSCPLSNSFYATVREENNILFLYIKTPEKIHEPVNMYEKIELNKEYNEALSLIEERLANFDPFLVHKCKQRLTKLTQYLERKKSIREKITVTAVCKGKNRLEKLRSKKALNKVKFEKNMEEELYERLKEGVFGKEMKEKHERKVSYLFEESDDSEIIKKKEKKKEVLEW